MSIFNHPFRQYLVYLLLLICAILWLYVAFIPGVSDYGYGGADNIMHYLIARYSLQHPELFLHHWGKPVFTILSFPFAQAGIKAIYVFNIIVSLLSCYFCWRIAEKTGLKHSSLVIVLLAFSPVFFLSTPTALTEPLFAFFIVLGLLLFVRKNFIASAIVFSFTIFIRTESYVLLPVYATAFVFVRQWKALPFLVTGFLVFSMAGIPVYGDFFWFFTHSPYEMNETVYDRGSLFYYVLNYKWIFGLVSALLILIAVFRKIIIFFKGRLFEDMNKFAVDFLVFGVPFVFVAAHSVFYWKIGGSSMGLLRVMAGILPLAAIAAMNGYDYILRFFKITSNRSGVILTFSIVLLSFLFLCRMQPGLIVKAQSDELLIQEAAIFLHEHLDNQNTVVFFNPLIAFYLEKDPWGEFMHPVIEEGFPDTGQLQSGDLIVWDAHFGSNEGGVELEQLISDEGLFVLKSFKPEETYIVMGENDYEIYIFKKE